MKKKRLTLLSLFFAINYLFSQQKTNEDFTKFVDQYIGTSNDGAVFIGTTVPSGMVKLGADIREYHKESGYHHSNSGYSGEGDLLYGFSHTHVSGTGGGGKYGNILLAPITGDVKPSDYACPRKDESSAIGYFAVTSTKYNVRSELTSTQGVGFHQYTFPKSDKAGILIDAGHYLIQGANWGEGQELVGSEIKILSNTEIEGYSRVRWGWNKGGAYTVYFYAVFDTPAQSVATWKNNQVHEGNKSEFDSGEKTGAVMYFKTNDNQKIKVKVGISFVSIGKAKNNLEKEIAHWNFDQTRKENVTLWNSYLSRIKVETKNEDLKKMFYTAMYHALLMPTFRNDENPLWKSGVPYYDDFYAIWDTYRTLHPFLTLVFEKKQIEIINSMIDIYKYDNYMPDARSGNVNGRTQGGSNCDIVIADAFVKGLKGIDYETAFKAMVKDAEVPPGDNEQKEGRGGIVDYNNLGYVSTSSERSGSRTVEYGNCDYAIAQVAKGLGKTAEYEKYIKRASNWQNLWNKDVQYKGATGFIIPKDNKGKWITDIKVVDAGSWNYYFYESNSWEYSMSIPHDVNGLINLSGGKEKFLQRLDTTFIPKCNPIFGNCLYNVNNEPGFITPCLYLWIGRPDRTSVVLRQIIKDHFNITKAGIPGNDDSGAMSTFFAFHSMGIYPNGGQDVYLITTPMFSKSTITMDNGKQFIIDVTNLSDKNIFIQSAKLNGQPLNQAWFKHTEIKEGGKLELVMGAKPSSWGTTNPPPSLSLN